MFTNPAASWHHGNRYEAPSACDHCGGTVGHERWCITRCPLVQYAFAVVLDPKKLAFADRLILHALGVSWEQGSCAAACQRA